MIIFVNDYFSLTSTRPEKRYTNFLLFYIIFGTGRITKSHLNLLTKLGLSKVLLYLTGTEICVFTSFLF